jgi:hypothetical protein
MKRGLFFVLAMIVVCLGAMTAQAQAQASRTWVSGVGDDANPCSRTAPCKTFAGAISKTADCGEIDALDPGGFGTVTITKGIKIDGGGGEGGQVASILASGTPGVTINNSSPNCPFVVLRNLDIQGVQSGTIGVNILQGAKVSLENVDVENFTQQCVNFQPSTNMNLVIYNTNLEGCQGGGVVSLGAPGNLNRVNIEKSTIQRSGVGFTAHQNTSANIHNSMISNNGGGGVLADTSTTAQVSLDLSTIANNQVFGVHATSGGIIRMSACSVAFTNGTGLLADGGGQILTWMNNWVGGNNADGGRSGTITPI